MCKAILDEESTSNTGVDWATSKRCILSVADDSFNVAGNTISFDEIKKAVIRIVPSAFFYPGCIFSIETETGTFHHFGLSYTKFWRGDFPFEIERVHAKVPLLWIRRIVLIGAIGYLLWSNIVK